MIQPPSKCDPVERVAYATEFLVRAILGEQGQIPAKMAEMDRLFTGDLFVRYDSQRGTDAEFTNTRGS
jgi:hypothetical protein